LLQIQIDTRAKNHVQHPPAIISDASHCAGKCAFITW
jgi:hypothetical protein